MNTIMVLRDGSQNTIGFWVAWEVVWLAVLIIAVNVIIGRKAR